MTDIDKIVYEGLWNDVEGWFDGIEDMLSHRCYQPRSLTGIRATQLDVRKHLTWIDDMLLEIERMGTDVDKTKLGRALQRVEEGMTTVADAKFLREILGLNAEKVVPNPEEWPFEPKSAR